MMSPLQLLLPLLVLLTPAAHGAIPTSYIDIRRTEKQDSSSAYRNTYLFRIEATASNFAPHPPKAPEAATRVPMSEWHDESNVVNIEEIKYNDKESTTLHAQVSNKGSRVTHPAHQLTLSPDTDYYLCKEAKGQADYKDGSNTGNIFDSYGTPITNDFPLNKYLLVPRGYCTFEAKARSAQRLGAKGIIIYNTLESRYKLIDSNKGSDSNSYGNEDDDVYDQPKNVPQWDNTIWPRNRIDYECGTSPAGNKGEYHPHKAGVRAEISVNRLDFDPAPYDASNNDGRLTGTSIDGSLCAEYIDDDETFVERCPSERCLLTGRNATDDGSKLEACCAWDTPVVMSGDGDDDGDSVPQDREEKIVIPTLFVTMNYGDKLLELVRDTELNDNSAEMEYISIVPYERWSPDVHFATIFMWLFASLTVWLACYASSKVFRSSWKKISLAVNEGVLVFDRSARNSNAPAEEGRERAETEDTVELADDLGDLVVDGAVENDLHLEMTSNGQGDNDSENDADDSTPKTETEENSNEDDFVGGSPSHRGEPVTSEDQTNNNVSDENAQSDATTLDQGAQRQPHAVNLQSSSTTAAIRMKEFQMYHYILVLVAVFVTLFIMWYLGLYNIVTILYGIGGAHLMARYIFRPLTEKFASKFLGKDASEKLESVAFLKYKWIDIGSLTYGYAFAIAWVVLGFSYVQPLSNTYYWMLQDVMGVLYCIVVLTSLEMNSVMIPVVTMLMVFAYTMFYALLARGELLGSSILVDITKGASAGIIADYCDNYHWDPACIGSQSPLPLLLVLPMSRDFRGNFAMIGLGEILIPGLLISFAARYDGARMLVKKCTQASRNAVSVEFGTMPSQVDSATNKTQLQYYLGRVKTVFKGYFGPSVISYTLALLVAYLVDWMTGVTQATLLYIVPICLGTTAFVGVRRRELSELWSGPRVLTKANRLVAVADKIPELRSAAATEANNNLAETTSVA
mmetsp:Transcript_19720/g.28088  ORF Transcript_19720/g.28088 Transcript_19720/m.28088 type:complete len:968 (-) Transcript_19720:153-3056(-)